MLLSRAAHASPATDRDPAFQPSRFTELYFPIAVLFRHEVMCVINAGSSFDLVDWILLYKLRNVHFAIDSVDFVLFPPPIPPPSLFNRHSFPCFVGLWDTHFPILWVCETLISLFCGFVGTASQNNRLLLLHKRLLLKFRNGTHKLSKPPRRGIADAEIKVSSAAHLELSQILSFWSLG